MEQGIGRTMRRALTVACALASVIAVSGQAFAGPARPTPGSSGPSATTTTLPPLPKVPLSLTDGQPAQKLLDSAIELSSVGIDTSALETAIAATQAKMDSDATAAAKASSQAALVDAEAQAARSRADAATSAFDNTDAAMKSAVIDLYTSGPSPLTISPDAGPAALYATDYAESALSPYGVLATRAQDKKSMAAALQTADSLQKKADKAAKKAATALAAEQAEAQRLQNELKSISAASAAEVSSDHLALAGQAGQELLSASSLQFNPKTPNPPPVSTTPVALTWAFAELGQKYVWGATGPKTFDCSGLTQFVWRAAGVSIPRVAADQDGWSIPVPLSQLLPGDLVFYGKTDIHHVGIYIGEGLMINAPHTGTVVQVSSIWWSDLAGFGRVHAPGTPVPPHQTPTTVRPARPAVVPTAKPVPSQVKPPKGWKPSSGSTSPIGPPSTVPPAPVTTTLPAPTTTTIVAPTSTTSLPTSTTSAAGPTTTTGSAG